MTSTYLVNPSFETLKASDGTTDVTVKTKLTNGLYGWEVADMSDYQVESEASGSSSGFVNGGTITPTDGTYYYFNRQGWANKNSELKTTTKAAVTPGNYYFVFDYKAADYSNQNNAGNNGTTIGITVKNASSETLATLPAAKLAYSITNNGSNPGTDAYMHNAPWSKRGVAFTVTSSSVLTFAVQQNMKNSGRSDIVYDNFKLYRIEENSSIDVSGLIANHSFETGNVNGWSLPNSSSDTGVKTNSGNYATTGTDGTYLFNTWWQGVPLTQTIAKMPQGKYTLKAALASSDANEDAKLFLLARDNHSDVITITHGTSGTFNDYTYDFYVSDDEGATIGVVGGNADGTYNAGGHWWYKADNFRLIYLGAVQNTKYSITQDVATAVTNDKWYAVEIPIDGDYRIISSVDNTVKYTQDGYKISSDISTSVDLTAGEKQVVNLNAGMLYVQAANDATLTIKPDVYTYSVGAGTPSVANNGYTQSNTMTITFASAATNDPDGALSILDDSKIKVNSVAATASITDNVLTITLADALTTSTDYAVSIEAGAVGYNVDNTNEAISLTAKTPVLFDGTFFIATSDETQFISRGGNSNTEAILDEFGIAATFTTNGENVTTITFLDNNKHLAGGSQSIYNDKTDAELEAEETGKGARAYWTITANEDGYSFYSNKWSKYIGKGTGAESPNYPTVATYTDATPYKWMLVTPDAHATKVAAYKDANAAAVATAAGLSASTVTGLKTIIEGAGWVSENVAVTDAIASTQEKYQFADSETPISENLTGLENGIYKVKLSVFKRIAGNADTYNLYNNNQDSPTAYLFAGDNKAQVPSVMSEYSPEAYTEGWDPNYAIDGKNFPNSKGAAGQAFNAGRYTLEVFAYVDGGSLNIGLKNPAKYANYNWLCYRDLVVTRYYPGVSATIGATGWTTFASPFALDLSSLDGATAYYASDVDGETVTMTSTDQAAVQAGEGIMLKGTANAEIIIPVVASGTNISGNLLVGCTSATDITDATPNYADIYVLGIKSETTDVAEFQNVKNYIYNDGGDSRTVSIPAGKAYLKAPALSARGLRIVIADDVTGINEAQATGVEAVVKEGKFIENGKIVIFMKGMKFNANGQVIK